MKKKHNLVSLLGWGLMELQLYLGSTMVCTTYWILSILYMHIIIYYS